MDSLQDEAECIANTMRFFRALDARDHAWCVFAFAPGGVWHRQGKAMRTAQEMHESLDQRSPDRLTSHLVTNVITERIVPDRIGVQFILTAFEGQRVAEGLPVAEGGGMMECRDEYVRTLQGWRLAEKRSRPLFKLK